MFKRNIDWLPLTHPQLGTWPTTQACALTGNRTSGLLVLGMMPNPLNHTGQGSLLYLHSSLASRGEREDERKGRCLAALTPGSEDLAGAKGPEPCSSELQPLPPLLLGVCQLRVQSFQKTTKQTKKELRLCSAASDASCWPGTTMGYKERRAVSSFQTPFQEGGSWQATSLVSVPGPDPPCRWATPILGVLIFHLGKRG